MRITFDEPKRQLTLAKRGLDFAEAGRVFEGRHVSSADDRFDYGEVRQITVGRLGDDVVVVVWTERDATRRVISMRRASKDERDEYSRTLD